MVQAQVLAVRMLSLSGFRNYASARLEADIRPVVLTGHNGAGKTNILEAISLLTPGRGLRRAKISDADRVGAAPEQPWALAAVADGREGEVRLGTGRDPESGDNEKRLVRIDGKPSRSQAELARHLSVLWLTPQMEHLFHEGASAGRKFMDRLVYSFDPEHASRMNAYEYAMRERNRLLQMGRADDAWLGSLERTMAETGAAIASARLQMIETLGHVIAQSGLSFPKADLGVSGWIEERLLAGQAALAVENALRDTLAQGRMQDAAAGRALVGAHRSELHVTHRDKAMRAEACSMGEQKAMLLSIVLAQARAGAQWHGFVPILLLDEVINHLDMRRRLELFEEICQIGAQAWMTGTDPDLFGPMREKASFFEVREGTVSQALTATTE